MNNGDAPGEKFTLERFLDLPKLDGEYGMRDDVIAFDDRLAERVPLRRGERRVGALGRVLGEQRVETLGIVLGVFGRPGGRRCGDCR